MSKKRVRYADIANAVVGKRAFVQPLDHPDVPKWEWVFSSRVVKVTQSPLIVETLNTVYVPGDHAEFLPAADKVADAQPV